MADLYARVEGGSVVEERRFETPPDPNPKKGLDWRRVPPRPSVSAEHEDVELRVAADGLAWAKVPKPAAPVKARLRARVKAAAAVRILAIVPEWKQRNLTAQAALLAVKGQANWTAEERASFAAGRAIWDRVLAIRLASDKIEAAIEASPSGKAAHDAYVAARWPDDA